MTHRAADSYGGWRPWAPQFGDIVLYLVGLKDVFAARLVFYVLAVALSVAGRWLIFFWVIARLPREPVTLRSAMRAVT